MPPRGKVDGRAESPTRKYAATDENIKRANELGELCDYAEKNDVDPRTLSKRPMSTVQMTPEQSVAAAMFAHNLKAVDEHLISQGKSPISPRGEACQSYRREGQRMVANLPLHYAVGESIQEPSGYLAPGTTQVIHSHPKDGKDINGYPSVLDFYTAHQTSTNLHATNTHVEHEMMHDPNTGRFVSYNATPGPAGRLQHYELVNPHPIDSSPNKRLAEDGSVQVYSMRLPPEL